MACVFGPLCLCSLQVVETHTVRFLCLRHHLPVVAVHCALTRRLFVVQERRLPTTGMWQRHCEVPPFWRMHCSSSAANRVCVCVCFRMAPQRLGLREEEREHNGRKISWKQVWKNEQRRIEERKEQVGLRLRNMYKQENEGSSSHNARSLRDL